MRVSTGITAYDGQDVRSGLMQILLQTIIRLHTYHYDHYLFFHDHDDNYEPLDCVDYCQDHYEPEDHYDHYDLEVFGVFSEDDPGEFLLWGHSNFNSAIKYLLFYIL